MPITKPHIADCARLTVSEEAWTRCSRVTIKSFAFLFTLVGKYLHIKKLLWLEKDDG